MSFVRRILSFSLIQLIIEVAAIAVLIGLLQLVFRMLPHVLLSNVISNVVLALGLLALLFLATRYLEHRSLSEVGLVKRGFLLQLLFSFVLGGCSIGAVVGVLALLGFYRITSIAPLSILPAILIPLLVIFFAAAMQEEIIFRAIIFRLLERPLGSWIAVVLSAIFFGASHLANPHATLISAVAIMLSAGITIAAIYMLTRSLWWIIGFHWGWNFFEGPIFGAQISGFSTGTLFRASLKGPELWTGGTFGPEAGLVTIILIGCLGVILLVVAARRGCMITPRFLSSPAKEKQKALESAG
ncbi:CPBP family intramembrane metalloprotease [Ktedonosporobacter rubrisoli]|uniref:CPBP family intramembrane metalloprotease n=1 Tax=Ktedonosporobacter rubrisoli TaxID=2509675 RepID=A0A4P6JJV0_KTERU|nr:type II CAAX endopeptidase family protein [Ktedonosporobacter rubrisoli]QBD75220.1 CPBP family intramembrane metalloprotease [Ktedonosporobacter rubrisoli]